MSLTPDSASANFKESKQHLEHANTPAHTAHIDGETLNVDKAWERSVVRKVDWRLIPILSAIYAISLIDRTNISVARLAGMAVDLKLTIGERYSIITCLFFVPYVILEPFANLTIRKVGCRNQLSGITVLWGVVMIAMGFIKTWEQLAVCRVLLGIFESGFFPGCTFLIATWYTRFEMQKRMAFFYLTAMVASGFSQIIGYAISLLKGQHGLNGWRWVFIVFGAVTVGLGLISIFLIVDFPDKAKFLKADEQQLILDRVNADRGDAEADKISLGSMMKHTLDFKLWAFGLLFCCSTMPSYAFSYFLPVILAGGGYNVKMSLCLSAPPYVFAALFTAAMAFASDRFRKRAVFICASSGLCFVGLMIMAYGGKLPVRYFGSFLTIAGAQSNVPACLTFGANNVRSHSKRAISSAIIVGMGGIGGIFASLVYRQKDAPRYLPGLWATAGCQVTIWITCALLALYFKRKNAQADRGETEIEGSARFRYTI